MKITIEIQPSIPTTSPEFVAFWKELNGEFVKSIRPKEFDYSQTSKDPYPLYGYTFESQEGRQWDQTVHWKSGYGQDEPYVTLPLDKAVSERPQWKVAEIEAHLAFRDLVFKLTKMFSLTLLNVKWEDL